MSFILDALKKLEQKRQQDSVPGLTTIHTPHLHKPKKRPVWPFMLLIALLLNAAILTAWLSPWSSDVEDKAVQTASDDTQDIVSAKEVMNTPETASTNNPSIDTLKAAHTEAIKKPSAPATPAPVEQIPPVKPAEEPATVLTEKPIPVEKETALTQSSPEDKVASLGLSPSIEELDNLKEIIKEERDLAEINDLPVDNPASSNSEDKPERQILELSELPAEIRKEIPDISINGHIYSNNPSSRLTNINGSLVREGDTVTRKLKVEEITTTGVIFDYEGLRFRVRAF